jgi:catechol 2,3-dioxygenase-like lactoylglutathione lyase family enzyme
MATTMSTERRPARRRDGGGGVTVDVLGLDHIYIAVSDLERSQRFYDAVMAVLDFRKVARPLAGGDHHVHYFNRVFQFSLRPARSPMHPHDSYSPGLHHFCFRVSDRDAVDAVARELRARGIAATEPRMYPEYHDDYYATFFEDPDGIRLEVVNHMANRRAAVEHWSTIPPIEP